MPSEIVSRSWTFLLPIFSEWVDDGEFGDFCPKTPPDRLKVTFARGQVQLAEDQSIAPPGEKHYEFVGYVEMRNPVSKKMVQEWIPDATFKKTFLYDREDSLTSVQNPTKRIKGVMPIGWTIGTERKSEQGKRNDMDEIKRILVEDGPIVGVKRVAEEYPSQYMRYHAGIEKMAQVLEVTPRDTDFKPNPFQQAMIEELQREPHPRHIYWVYDQRGHSGKSRLLTYLVCEMDAIELGGREIDIAYGYNGQRIVCFDIPRPTPITTYSDAFICAERLKNGALFSSKFMCKFKKFKPPHVVFMSNQPPPEGLWTKDRLQLITLAEEPPPFQPFSVFSSAPMASEPIQPVIEQSRAELIKEKIQSLLNTR